ELQCLGAGPLVLLFSARRRVRIVVIGFATRLGSDCALKWFVAKMNLGITRSIPVDAAESLNERVERDEVAHQMIRRDINANFTCGRRHEEHRALDEPHILRRLREESGKDRVAYQLISLATPHRPSQSRDTVLTQFPQPVGTLRSVIHRREEHDYPPLEPLCKFYH